MPKSRSASHHTGGGGGGAWFITCPVIGCSNAVIDKFGAGVQEGVVVRVADSLSQ